MKKLLALLLACLMLVSVLVSCQTGGGGTGDGTGDGNTTTDGNGDNEDEITSEEETEVVTDEWGRVYVPGTVPVDTLDFSVDGAPIEFNWIAWNNDYTNVDRGDYEKPADALQLNLVERNMQIEEELGIVFEFDY